MDVKIVVSKMLLLLARLIVLVYGVIGLIGVVWYFESIYMRDLIYGVAIAVSGIVVSLVPATRSMKIRNLYIALCLVGALAIAARLITLVGSTRSHLELVEQTILASCFVYLAAMVWLGKRKSQS